METMDLNQFDLVHSGVSGGKDSAALFFWLIYESGIPKERLVFTTCDTENEDPMTYAFIDLLRTHAPIRTILAERGFWDLAYDRRRFPSHKQRFCTQELKIIPTRSYIMELLRTDKRVALCSGVRSAEGTATNNRNDAQIWEYDDGFAAWVHRPILHYEIDQVWDTHKRYLSLDSVLSIVENDATMDRDHKDKLINRIQSHGIPRNPLYDMGAKRVGCFPCINSRKAEIRAMADFRPERIDFIAEQERRVGERSEWGFNSLFHRGTVPDQFRSLEITGTGIRTKTERTYHVATIRDVVKWSQLTKRHGGWWYDMAIDDLDMIPPASACDIGGMCE